MAIKRTSPYPKAFAYGVLGAFMMTVLLAALRWTGLSDFNFSIFLGSLLTLEFTMASWAIGFVWHLINGGIFGVAYCAVFKASGKATTARGTMLGFIHWLAFSFFMAFSPAFHRLIPSEIFEPGFFAINYGVITSVAALALHLIFGYILGNGLEGRVFAKRKSRRPRVNYNQRYA